MLTNVFLFAFKTYFLNVEFMYSKRNKKLVVFESFQFEFFKKKVGRLNIIQCWIYIQRKCKS